MTAKTILKKSSISKLKVKGHRGFHPVKHCAVCGCKKENYFLTLQFSFRTGKPCSYFVCLWCHHKMLDAKESRRADLRAKIKLRLMKFILCSPDGEPFRGDFAKREVAR